MILFAWLALIVGVLVLLVALREPLAARIGWRNALRHKRQTAVVVIGLLVGTAVVSASLTTGDSLETGLKETSIAALGDLDVLVRVPGDLYVPQETLDGVVAEPRPEHIQGSSSTVVARGAVEAPATDRYAGQVPVVGFDADEDAAFGPFIDAHGGGHLFGEELGPETVYVNDRLADRLLLEPGDTVNLTYRQAFLPFLPVPHWGNGTLVAASATPDPAGGWDYHHAPENDHVTAFDVPPGALGVVAVLFWQDPGGMADLDLELVDPQGRSYVNDTGMPGDALPVPSLPSLPRSQNNASPALQQSQHGQPVVLVLDREQAVSGQWELRVHAKHALDQPFTAVAAVLEPEYNLQRALDAAEALQEILGEDLGEQLTPDPDLTADARSASFVVERVVLNEGKGSFFGASTLFMQRETAQQLYGVEGRANWLKLTHTGEGVAGAEGSDETVRFVEDRLAQMAAARGSGPSSPEANLEAQPLKQDFLQASETAAALFTRFLGLVGSFTLVAGMLLIVNLFTMLGEERRRESGVARAVGLSRLRLVYSFLFEGGLYTLVAAALGALAGVLIAGALVFGLNTLSPPGSLFHVPLAPRAESLLLAFALGALLTFATVAVAAVRASRFDIAGALRDEERAASTDPVKKHRRQLALVVALFVLTLVAALFGSFLALSVGPLLLLFAAGPLLAARFDRERAWRWVSLVVIVWVVVGLGVLRTPTGFEGDLSTVARALALIVAASVFLVHAPAVPRLLSRLTGASARAASVVRVALAYPLRRRMRTGLTVSMYSLVILVLVVFSVLFTVMTPDPTRESGGYDLMGRAPVLETDAEALVDRAAPLPDGGDALAFVDHVDLLAQHREFGEERVLLDGQPPSGFAARSAQVYGFDSVFAETNGFTLFDWDPRFGDDPRDVWRAVAADPGLVLVSYGMVGDPTEPRGGDPTRPQVLTLNTTAGQRDYRVAGVTDQVHFSGIWMQRDHVQSLYPQAEGLYLFTLTPGADTQQVRGDLERSLRGMGMWVTSVEEEAQEIQAEADRVYYLLSAYLGLGILVGVASLGIVTSRAVLERRRETGMLRAICYTRRRVGAVLLTEALYLLLVSMVIGLGLGLVVAWAVFQSEMAGLPGMVFTVPWLRIGLLLGITLLATLVAVGVPVWRAGRTPPGEALRRVD